MFKRGNDIKTVLRVGKANKAIEIDYIFASIDVRPVPEQLMMSIVVTVSSREGRFIPLIQEGKFEEIEEAFLKTAKEEIENGVYNEGKWDHLLNNRGKLSAKFGVGEIKASGFGMYHIEYLKGKDIILDDKLYIYPEDLCKDTGSIPKNGG
jgi:hypothetical protein